MHASSVQKFNGTPVKLLQDDEMKAEKHAQLDDLRDDLYELNDRARAESEIKLTILLGMESWMPSRLAIITSLYCLLLQAELDLFQDRLRLIIDYYR